MSHQHNDRWIENLRELRDDERRMSDQLDRELDRAIAHDDAKDQKINHDSNDQ